MKRLLLSGVAAIALPGMAFANCPAITVADMGELRQALTRNNMIWPSSRLRPDALWRFREIRMLLH